MTGLDEILAGAKPPETEVPVCTRGDLIAQHQRLARQITEARTRAAADPRAAGSGVGGLVTQMEELREQIQAATVVFRLRALPRRRWRALVDEHPPRRVGDRIHDEDAQARVNNETFFPALIQASAVEPKLRDETWQALLDPDGELLNEQQYLKLARACWDLNKETPDVPFSLAGLLTTRNSGSDSGSPAPSE